MDADERTWRRQLEWTDASGPGWIALMTGTAKQCAEHMALIEVAAAKARRIVARGGYDVESAVNEANPRTVLVVDVSAMATWDRQETWLGHNLLFKGNDFAPTD